MEVQEVKEQLKSIFRQVINNNKVENWNEQDHPRDKQGKFTFKHGGATVDVFPDGKYADIKIYAPEGKTFPNGDTWYSTQKETDKAEEQAKEIIDETFGKVDKDENDKSEKGEGSAKDYYESEYQEALKEIAEGRDYAQINFNTNIGEMKSALAHLKRFDSDWDAYDVYENIKEYEDLSDDWNKEQIGRIAREKAAQETLKKWISEGKDRKNEYYKIYEPHKASNSKEQDMALIEELKKLITKVENTKGEKDMEIENEKVDKRDIIRQIMAIAGKEEASEEVKTIAKLAEKLAYDKSEAGTADNKCKNEDDEKEVKEVKEEVKEDVENKCKNSVDNSKVDYFSKLNEIYNSASQIKEETEYVSQADREKAAEDYFAK